MTTSEKFMVMVGDDFYSPMFAGTVTLSDEDGYEDMYVNGTLMDIPLTDELIDNLLRDWMADNELTPAQVERLLISPYIGPNGMYN